MSSFQNKNKTPEQQSERQMNTKHKGDLPFFVKHITLRRFLRRQFSKYSLKNQDRMADSVFRRLHLSQKRPLPRGFFHFCYCFLPRLYYVQNYSTTVQALCQGGFLKIPKGKSTGKSRDDLFFASCYDYIAVRGRKEKKCSARSRSNIYSEHLTVGI